MKNSKIQNSGGTEAMSIYAEVRHWQYAGKKFYDNKHYLQCLLRLFPKWKMEEFNATKKCKPIDLRIGDIVRDPWGRIGFVACVYKEPVFHAEYSDFELIVRQRENPYLKYKYYWKSMLGRFTRWRIAK
jgi:hypothetical protein